MPNPEDLQQGLLPFDTMRLEKPTKVPAKRISIFKNLKVQF